MSPVKRLTTFGTHLRMLRESTGATSKEVSERLEIDPSLLAKIERNERQPTKQLIKKIAAYFKADEKALLNEFLSDQIAYQILEQEADLDVLKVAEEKVSYIKNLRNG